MKIVDLTNPRHQQILAEEIHRAKRIISELADDRKLSADKIAKWYESNEELVRDFTHNGRSYSDILRFLNSGVASQYYLKTLIDAIDHLEGVAVDDADFYVAPTTAPGSDYSRGFSTNPYTTSAGAPVNRWTGD
jgi:hypothetical protein